MTRILIVEDDLEQARALSRVFRQLRPELSVQCVENGVLATEVLERETVDVVLTDLQMPSMDGFALLAWMHNHCPEVCVFTMSAFGDGSTAEQMDGLGAIDHFAKPVDAKSVLERLSESLAQSVRGHVTNVSLASFLQLLEMERKSCTLTVRCDEKHGLLVVRKGQLVAAQTGDVHGEAAAIAIISWPYSSIDISRHGEAGDVTIQSPLGFIVMEAMRMQDEACRSKFGNAPAPSSVWPTARRTFRPSVAPDRGFSFASSRPPDGALAAPVAALGIAHVETATGRVLLASASEECRMVETASVAAELLEQEAVALSRCDGAEGVEEIVIATSSRCEVIRPLSDREFVLLVYRPEDTNLVMARLELELFIASLPTSLPALARAR
jgi:CheY-like chemotaxis protein